MLLEFISHALSFDLVWIASLIMNNLHWVFAFVACVFFFYNDKKILMPFLLVILVCWAGVDLCLMSGWTYTVAAFMSIFYISRLVIMVVCEDIAALKNYLPIIFVIHFVGLFIAFNMFWR